MLHEAAGEGQDLITPQMTSVRVETGHARNGVVDRKEVVEVPEAFFLTAESAVIEQLTMARNATLRDYPNLAANSIVDRLAHEAVIDRSNATHVRDLVELEIRRGIEHLYEDARDRFVTRLSITLRSLIPLITRRSATK